MAAHAVHKFSRVVARSVDGMVVYGCAAVGLYAGCAATEVRHANQASPFEQKRQAALKAAATKRGGQ